VAVKNLNEEIVAREYQRLSASLPDFCGCATCRDDVMVYALNRIPAHYVTARRGAVLQHVAMQRDQQVADIAVALMRGFTIVHGAPRPEHAHPEQADTI